METVSVLIRDGESGLLDGDASASSQCRIKDQVIQVSAIGLILV